jgi:transcriptional regulator with XRE-family HTH domain
LPNRSKRRKRLTHRLHRGREARQELVSSHVAKAVAFQIRAMRERAGWSQAELARRCGTSQNAISRLESPNYGRPSITTLKKIAGAFDVALVVRYATFSELVDWVVNLNPESVLVPTFDQEESRLPQEEKTETLMYSATNNRVVATHRKTERLGLSVVWNQTVSDSTTTTVPRL